MVRAKDISVTLFLPGFLRYKESMFRELVSELPAQQQRLPALELIVSRAEKTGASATDFDSSLFELFHLPAPEASDYPVGALSYYLQTGEISERWYMHADPVYMQPNRDHLLLLGNEMIDIGAPEAEQLVNDINSTYHDAAWQMKMLSARRWVLETDRALSLQTYSLRDVTGKNINDYLPHGKDAAGWHALLNELQMFLHSHPLNRNREMQGQIAVNSVWFWGAGRLPLLDEGHQKDYVQCWSDQATALGLAKLCGIPRTDLPANGEAWLKYAITPGHHLLVVEGLYGPLDPYDWWLSLLSIEQHWLQPLLDALRKGDIAGLNLVSDTGKRFHLTAALSRRWWKRIKALV